MAEPQFLDPLRIDEWCEDCSLEQYAGLFTDYPNLVRTSSCT